MSHLTIPARALTGTGNNTRAFLTEREALILAAANGFRADEAKTWLREDGTIPLATGAKLALVPTFLRRRTCPTRTRIFQVYGYHWAGTDVTTLVGAA